MHAHRDPRPHAGSASTVRRRQTIKHAREWTPSYTKTNDYTHVAVRPCADAKQWRLNSMKNGHFLNGLQTQLSLYVYGLQKKGSENGHFLNGLQTQLPLYVYGLQKFMAENKKKYN